MFGTPKELRNIFEKFPEFDLNNTVIISNYPNMVEKYQTNDLIVPKFDPRFSRSSFEGDMILHTLVKYLTGLRFFYIREKTEDLRPLMQAKTFDAMLKRVLFNQQQYKDYV